MKKLISIVLAITFTIIMSMPIYAEESFNVEAKIVENNGTQEVEKENEPTKKVQNVRIRILDGEYENEEYEMEYIITEDIESLTSNAELKEDQSLIVSLEENEGEVVKVSYKDTISSNYVLYIMGIVLIIILLIISRKRAIIIYLITIILVGIMIILSLQNAWNLIMVSSIISFIITAILFISINKISKETVLMIIRAILGIAISGILIYILFDIMHLQSINIKITEKLVDIKSLICSATILFSCGIYNSIAISGQYIFYANNKTYKTKSDNIIEGQRSLKL